MESECIIQGRLIGSKELESIQRVLTDHPQWSRTRISRTLCELWDWRAPNGQAHLQEITNNTRFLILPWVQVPHLASHLLSLVVGRLCQDWHRKYARPLRLIETFVDTSRFGGGCYGAAEWIALGQTTGRTRQDSRNQINAPPKAIWVYPLSRYFRQALST